MSKWKMEKKMDSIKKIYLLQTQLIFKQDKQYTNK